MTMEPKFKIALINHSFQINYFSRRWEIFAEQHPNVDVTLIAPREHEWYAGKGYTYDGGKKYTSYEFDRGNYHRRLVDMAAGWESDGYKPLLDELKPDVIYIVGSVIGVVRQISKLRKKYYPSMKVINFDMRGLPKLRKPNTIQPYELLRQIKHCFNAYRHVSCVNKNMDAIFCHYPEAVRLYRKEGYKGPIYMQTQVGVNAEWFHPDDEARKEIREKYNIADSTYVFGSATRFTTDKGIDDIVNALPKEGDWKYIMMGTGSEEDVNRLKNLVKSLGLEDKIIMPGMIDWYEIAKYWNAVDCCIHVPRTTEHWVETFSLTAIQPQATKKPVIGNTSGSVPYQIGFDEMIVPEGDIQALHDKIQWVLDHQAEAAEIGEKMYRRCMDSFSVQHLDDMFYDTIVEDVLQGKYDEAKIDMTKYTPKKHE